MSLGVQSLRDDILKSLGRIHSVAEAKAAIDIARATFERFSFDLIYARPGQTLAAWKEELRDALAIAGQHLSLYQLTIEPETPFAALHAAGKLVIPDEDAALALYEATQELTAAAGLPAYEISNHAAPGEESRHNLLYWRYGEYAGCGPGAHGRLAVGGTRHATSTERNPERWAERVEAARPRRHRGDAAVGGRGGRRDAAHGLRLGEGVDLARLERMTGARPSAAAVTALTQQGLIEAISQAGPGLSASAPPATAASSSTRSSCVSP